jgi:hypothetical protein
MSKPFGKAYNVAPIPSEVGISIEHVADKVDAKPADLPLLAWKAKIWFGLSEGIEIVAIITDFDFKSVFRQREPDCDFVIECVPIGVFDRVGHYFLDGEMGCKNNFGRSVVGFKKPSDSAGSPGKIIKIIANREDKVGHGRTSLKRGIARQAFCQGGGWLQ